MKEHFPPIVDLVKKIEEATGLIFEKDEPNNWDESPGYTAVKQGAKFDVHYSTYMDTTTQFISVGWSYKTSGGGCPCDSVDEAICRIKHYIEYAAKERERLKPNHHEMQEEYQQLSLFDIAI